MVIKGIGVDIEDISRFRDTPFESNRLFYEKIFTEEEISYCLSKTDPYPYFAARFCAKEAFIKTLESFPRKLLFDYKHIKVRKEGPKPFIEYQGEKHLLSLSHDKEKTVAFVVVQ